MTSVGMREARALFLALASTILSASVSCGSEEPDAKPASGLTNAMVDPPVSKNGEEDVHASPPATPKSPPECPPGRWCSSLYPPTWSPTDAPDKDGRFLHDFSFAGYRYGEPVPTVVGPTFDVTTYGADPNGTTDATAAIQAAIDAASKGGGGVVFFPKGTYRIGGKLTVRASNVVLRGTGKSSHLRFSQRTGLAHSANLTFAGSPTREAARPLVVDAPERSTSLYVASAAGLAAGDEIAVGWTITPAFTAEHGMTGVWTAFANDYAVFFRSKIVSITPGSTASAPTQVTIDVPLRYRALERDGAQIQRETGFLREVGIEHLGISNAVDWSAAWSESRVHALAMRGVSDAWIKDVHSVPADEAPYHLRSSGVLIENAKRVSVLGSTMSHPQNRGSGGNGYLFEVSRTSEVLFADCEAHHGRHNFIQNWGFGNSGTVLLRCVSTGGGMTTATGSGPPVPSYSEHHHSLAMATLVDDCRLDDGFALENRGSWSDGAGHTATGSVVWRPSGSGKVTSKQFGWGYVIGSRKGVTVDTNLATPAGAGTFPEDFVEGKDLGETLFPSSLYEHQRARRVANAGGAPPPPPQIGR